MNQYGHSPLHRAVVKENEKIVDLLLKGGADVNLADEKNRTALHIASKKGIPINEKTIFASHNELIGKLIKQI